MCRSGLWLGKIQIVFSLTRDPIDTLESSAYIDLISVPVVKGSHNEKSSDLLNTCEPYKGRLHLELE